MSLEAKRRLVNGITVVDLEGQAVAGEKNVDSLRETLLRVLDDGGSKWMLLNCQGLAQVDSAGLGNIVAAYAAVIRRGGVVRLLSPGRRLKELLTITRTDTLFDIEYDEAAALAGFNAIRNSETRGKLAHFLAAEE